MFTAVIPSRLLIAIAVGGAAICTASALASADPVVVEGAAVAGGVLLFALCGADLLLSILDWRRSPLEMRRQLPHAFAIGVPVTVQVSLDNQGGSRRLGWYQEYADPTLTMPGLPMPFDVGPRQRELLSVEVTPTARGLQHFDAGQVRLRSRLGLLDLDLRIGES